MADIVRKLSRAKRHEGAFFPGVPLRDLTQADLDDLPAHLRESVLAGDLYYEPKAKEADTPVENEKPKPARARRTEVVSNSDPGDENPQPATGEEK